MCRDSKKQENATTEKYVGKFSTFCVLCVSVSHLGTLPTLALFLPAPLPPSSLLLSCCSWRKVSQRFSLLGAASEKLINSTFYVCLPACRPD